MQDLVVGTSVRGQFDDDKEWYDGHVIERINRSILVLFDNGDKEWYKQPCW